MNDKYAGAAWNQLMENETKESIAEMFLDSLTEIRELKVKLVDALGYNLGVTLAALVKCTTEELKDKQLAFNNEKSNERLLPPQTGLYGLLLDTDENKIVGGELSEGETCTKQK